jgi:4-oxalocrotonate tautomerase
MPMIKVEMFPGRTDEQKRAMANEVTEAFVRTCDVAAEHVSLIITEIDPSHWAEGGVFMADKGL